MTAAMESRPPQSLQELLQRAQSLRGRRLGDLAHDLGVALPADARRSKGFIGMLVERALGAVAGSQPTPDFADLGIELKTIPLSTRGRPAESTFVATIPLSQATELEWSESAVHHKLLRILWVAVEAVPKSSLRADAPPTLGERRITAVHLWSPSADDEMRLRDDFEDIVGRIALGQADGLTAHLGQYLQARPKAAHAAVRRTMVADDGSWLRCLPLGFYLRAAFTARILGCDNLPH